ncbi:MAG TPA: hypothetical protein GX707_04125 [Epulopiscium sp.]|nr:hypothetical protein [Candidatus Epulonipiscium sp.]
MEMKMNPKQKKSNISIIITSIFIIIIGIVVREGISFNKTYNNPSMIGQWLSQQTGKVVEFTDVGIVNVDQIKAGEYSIKSENLLVYTIEGHTFEMNYKIEKRNLTWGLAGEEEKFDRKGI